MRSLWNQFDHHTALHNAKPDRYPAVPVELKKLVDKLEHIWVACRYQGRPMESIGGLKWTSRFLQDDIPKMKDFYGSGSRIGIALLSHSKSVRRATTGPEKCETKLSRLQYGVCVEL